MDLTSQWGVLHNSLIAQISPVDNNGNALEGNVIHCPMIEADFEVQLNWQSPFEDSGPESKAPNFSALLQSGKIQPLLSSNNEGGGILDDIKGRSGITKLNSTQIFNGMPPASISATLLFRAWSDAEIEVEALLNQLMSWALPAKLSQNGIIAALAGQGEETGVVNTILPSEIPTMVAVTYKGRTYSPMVIENVGVPLTSPSDANGNFIELSIPVKFATLTAIDAEDWNNLKG